MKKSEFYGSTAWKYFRKYMLLKFADKDYNVRCCTSNRVMSITDKNCHLGHYIKVYNGNSTNYNTAFNEYNVAPQHYQDNRYMGGRQDEMRMFLVRKYGNQVVEQLELMKKFPLKLDKFTMKYIGKEYKEKLKDLIKIKGNPWKK